MTFGLMTVRRKFFGDVTFLYCFAECHYAECRHADCRYADCHYEMCRHTGFCSAVILPCVIMPNVITLSVVMLTIFIARLSLCQVLFCRMSWRSVVTINKIFRFPSRTKEYWPKGKQSIKARVSAVFGLEQSFFMQYKKLIEGSSEKVDRTSFKKQISCYYVIFYIFNISALLKNTFLLIKNKTFCSKLS
jgi:hypothetical protein